VWVPGPPLPPPPRGTFPEGSLTKDDAFYAPLPLFHIGGKNALQIMARCGGQVVLRQQFDTSAFWSDVARHRCTTTLLLGAMANFLARQEPRPNDAATPLDKVVMVPVISRVQAFARRFGVRICTVFNMTETSCPITSNGWIEDDDESCGIVRPGYSVRLVDEHDREVPMGELGELVVRSDEPWTQMAGYHGMAEKTVEAWRNHWLHTGDGFVRDERGRFHFVDRQKDAIRRRGENISSFEVEAEVNTHPAVLESAAVAASSEWSEDEVLVVVAVRPGQQVDPAELHAYLAERLPRFMVPRYLRFVDALPKTPTEKIRKAELRATGVDESTWDATSLRTVADGLTWPSTV
jgi:carnitine-CoA ligase